MCQARGDWQLVAVNQVKRHILLIRRYGDRSFVRGVINTGKESSIS